jgi:phenylacetate-CoA ligase
MSDLRNGEYFDCGEIATADELRSARWQAVSEVVGAAFDDLPFYKNLWTTHGFHPSPAVTPDDFARIPPVRKLDLVSASRQRRSAFSGVEAMLGLNPSNLVMTSGTSGFHTFAALTGHDLDGAGLLAQARELWTMKVRPGMRVLSISPAWHALGLYETRALTEIGAIPVMPSGTLTPRFVGDILNAVDQLKPEHLLVTARAIRMLLEECDRRKLDAREVFRNVRYIGCAGEPLSLPFREHLRDRFELEDVFERGGSGDGMFGGAECFAHRGHHVSADVHFVEIVSPMTGEILGEGERGTALVTNLTLGRSVYIRFDTEDVAEIVPGPCPCGRTHPVVEFYGRLADSIVIADRVLAPGDVRLALDDVPATRFLSFAMVSDGAEGLVIGLQGAEELAPGELSESATGTATRLGVPVSIVPAGVETTGWKEARIKRPGGRG